MPARQARMLVSGQPSGAVLTCVNRTRSPALASTRNREGTAEICHQSCGATADRVSGWEAVCVLLAAASLLLVTFLQVSCGQFPPQFLQSPTPAAKFDETHGSCESDQDKGTTTPCLFKSSHVVPSQHCKERMPGLGSRAPPARLDGFPWPLSLPPHA